MAHSSLRPRTTSAIVSSLIEGTTFAWTTPFIPDVYVLDKALNYGNSGGPIVATETGKAHAFCSKFQPVYVPQSHLLKDGKPVQIMIPSLYGVIASLGAKRILKVLKEKGVPTTGR